MIDSMKHNNWLIRIYYSLKFSQNFSRSIQEELVLLKLKKIRKLTFYKIKILMIKDVKRPDKVKNYKYIEPETVGE